MYKKWFLLIVGILFIGIAVLGCGKVAQEATNPNMSTTPATPPAGTTALKMSTGNISASGNSLNFNFLALNQDNQALTNLTLGNLQAKIYDSYPTGLSVSEVKAEAIIDVTFSEITSGANTGKPIAVGLTLDKSGSMGFDDATYRKVTTLEAAASKFVDLMSSNSMAAVILFDDHVSLEAAMTSDKTLLKDRIATREAYGGATAIYDAIKVALDETKKVSSTNYVRAILAMTDGQDNSSYVTNEAGITAEAITSGLPIYTIGLFNDSYEADSYRAPLVRIATTTTGTSDSYFEIIAGVTGLSAQSVVALGALESVFSQLAEGLTNSYSATSTLSANLVSGQQYWLVLKAQNYGSLSYTVVSSFIAH